MRWSIIITPYVIALTPHHFADIDFQVSAAMALIISGICHIIHIEYLHFISE